MSIAFVPLFLFASMYSQIALGDDSSEAGIYLLTFFAGFAGASQIGGRMLDTSGARVPVVAGSLIAAVGFVLWGRELPDLDYDSQWQWIVLTGAGLGLVLGPVSTDAINRAARTAYGEVTGITQTVRNFGASIGLAILGTILILENKSNLESSLGSLGVPKERADAVAQSLSESGGGNASGFAEHGGKRAQELFEQVQLDFALSSRTVFYGMAGAMALSFVVSLIALRSGKVAAPGDGQPAG
jgi:hypothetical protein